MKKTLCLFILFVCFLQFTKAQQNLVPNGDFEQINNCPDTNGDFYYAKFWFINSNTPDYFNKCATYNSYSIPSNGWGYQNTTSNGYGGFYPYYSISPNAREIMGNQFSSPLVVGTKYYVSYKLNVANISNCVARKIGCEFSMNKYQAPNSLTANNSPKIATNALLADTLNWQLVNDSIIADSAYNFIYISNFYDDLNSDTIIIGASTPLGYYSYLYIDDVCVSTSKNTCNIINSIQENYLSDLILYPNPSSDYLYFKNTSENGFDIKLFNVFGQEVIHCPFLSDNKIDVHYLPVGIYSIVLSSRNGTIRKKITINH